MNTIKDVEKILNVSKNTAKSIVNAIWQNGSNNIIKYKNTIGIINMDTFLLEMNKAEENRTKCKRRLKDSTKEIKHTGSISTLMAKEYADQLAAII